MPRASDGTMTLTGTFAIASTVPLSPTINSYIGDLVTETSDSVSRSGKGGWLANLSAGGHRLYNLADGVAATDAVTVRQVPLLSGNNTFIGLSQTFTFVDSGATTGPFLNLFRDSASPAAGDALGAIEFDGRDSVGAQTPYGYIGMQIVDPTNATEAGKVWVNTVAGGAYADRLYIASGVYTPGATGGDKGVNTINATDYYQNGNLFASGGNLSAANNLGVGGGADVIGDVYSHNNLSCAGNVYAASGNFNGASSYVIVSPGWGAVYLRPQGAGAGYPTEFIVNNDGAVNGRGYRVKGGFNNTYRGNTFNIDWDAGRAHMWIDATYIGNIAYVSDYRIKRNVAELASTWDKVKALRPIRYNHREFTPPTVQPKEDGSRDPLFPADDIEHWGFVAHELQETLIADAATRVRDDPEALQSPNPWTVIAALTKALQEAMARIEALEKGNP